MEGKRSDSADGVGHRREQTGRPRPLAALAGAVTPIGWAVIVLIVAGVAVAAVFQWVEALACALAGVVALVLAATRVAWKPPHLVSIRVPNERIVPARLPSGEITVRNERNRPVRSGIIEATDRLGHR